MKAFKNKQKVKDKYLLRVINHRKADEIVKGQYWENGKGCAVGCTIEGSDHSKYETELGIPKELAYLEDVLFEELTNGESKAFPQKFLEAVNVGADLSLVVPKFVVWQFEDKKYGLKNIKEVKDDKEIYRLCREVAALYKRVIEGEKVSQDEFYDLYLKIDGAWAWAGARAWAWAWAGAGARVGARARAGARAWAWAWAGADYDKNISAASKKLLSLIKECK